MVTPDDYEVYISEDMIYRSEYVDMEGDPTSCEEAIKSHGSSKWLMVMEGEIRLTSAN